MASKTRFLLSFFLAAAVFSPLFADATHQPATIITGYQGGYKDEYPQELNRVQSFVLVAQSNIATELGLQYGQGFAHPVTIRFADGAPSVSETPFFYVQPKGSGDSFTQDLVVNVEAYARHQADVSLREANLRSGFRYALTELMLNDLSAGDSGKALPLWIQEGLSVYASHDGDNLVEDLSEKTRRSRAPDLVVELNSPGPYLTPREWANYYLAIKYVASTGALQSFVREIIIGKSPADAVRSALGQEWPAFVSQVREFSAKAFAEHAASDDDSKK